MISEKDGFDTKARFRKDDGTTWEIVVYFPCPSFVLRNVKTGREDQVGVGGLSAQKFTKLPRHVQIG